MKEEEAAKKEYQAKYRENKKAEKGIGERKMRGKGRKESMKIAEDDHKKIIKQKKIEEKKLQIQEYQKLYREKMKAKKSERMKKGKIYLDNYKKLKGKNKNKE